MRKSLLLFLYVACCLHVVAATAPKSAEAQALMDFMRRIEGSYTLSGAMANVNWNINEAEWVHKHTGKWPAINCFDFIHHIYSAPNSWIDYSNTRVAEQWHQQGGIVAAMWHWNVPSNDKKGYSFYYGTESDKTTFDVKKIFNPSSAEYALMMKDIDQIGSYLKQLKEKGIAVLWRPLHEAGGMWFWWGRDADACAELWRVMYRRFQDAGLDNLIWVWTSAAAWNMPYSDGYRWYPGDDYVDIVSIDIYNDNNARNIYTSYYQMLRQKSPDKPAALSECGNVANISDQWNNGAKWLFFMPWYDYERTMNPNNSNFNSTAHGNANIAWWNNAFSCDFVLTRDAAKTLMATAIAPVTVAKPSPSSAVYRLDGSKVQAVTRKGIYIVGGKKILVK